MGYGISAILNHSNHSYLTQQEKVRVTLPAPVSYDLVYLCQ